jgi:alpha-beta hydrolase superfamily lysophospholipase
VKRALTRAAATAAALIVVLLATGWSTHSSWAPGMLVSAPAPDGVPAERPGDVRHVVEVVREAATVRAWVFDPPRPPRGTVLLLHGIRDSKLNLVDSARRHAARGLRAVAVDSRGHGESSGRYLTYGVEESRDLAALVDQLERRALLVRPLAVVGTSYGAATALQFAAIDARAEKVVALAPFASLRQVVRSYLAWILGAPARWIPAPVVDSLIDDSARRAGFDPDRACPRCVAPQIRAAVLLVHSRDDERIPWRHSVEIRNALGSRRELLLVDGVRHVDIGSAAGVEQATRRWLATP